MTRLHQEFFTRDAREVARDLLGRTLVTLVDGIRTSGTIIETEAYLGSEDMASHAYRGLTGRNGAMFLGGGHAYVYFIYGMYYCFNVVTGEAGSGQAVLVRGLAPLDGVATMRERRGRMPKREIELTNGPGKLAIALAIGPELNGADLMTDRRIWIEEGDPIPDDRVLATPRIGISKAVEHEWRWVATAPSPPA
jgi:DNA-3-methyladenine glycosylase